MRVVEGARLFDRVDDVVVKEGSGVGGLHERGHVERPVTESTLHGRRGRRPEPLIGSGAGEWIDFRRAPREGFDSGVEIEISSSAEGDVRSGVEVAGVAPARGGGGKRLVPRGKTPPWW